MEELDHKNNAEKYPPNIILEVSLTRDSCTLDHLSHRYLFYVNIVYCILANNNTFKMTLKYTFLNSILIELGLIEKL